MRTELLEDVVDNVVSNPYAGLRSEDAAQMQSQNFPRTDNLITESVARGRHATKGADSTSLLRALSILELVAHKSGGLTNAEISRRLKIATSTTSYILSRLEREGYLKRHPDHGRYEIGLKVVALAHSALREMGLRRAAEPVLHRVAAETRYSALIGVLERGLIMIVDKVEKPDLFKIDMDIGVRYPAHTTALGKVLLSHLPLAEVTALFDGYAAWPDPKKAVLSRERRMQELVDVKANGYAISDGELFPGIWAVAAPIFDSTGEVRAAVSATGGCSSTENGEIKACVMRAAREISIRLTNSETARKPSYQQH
jgi:IclR family transcriptional regulator, KDG regulon repressor